MRKFLFRSLSLCTHESSVYKLTHLLTLAYGSIFMSEKECRCCCKTISVWVKRNFCDLFTAHTLLLLLLLLAFSVGRKEKILCAFVFFRKRSVDRSFIYKHKNLLMQTYVSRMRVYILYGFGFMRRPDSRTENGNWWFLIRCTIIMFRSMCIQFCKHFFLIYHAHVFFFIFSWLWKFLFFCFVKVISMYFRCCCCCFL